MEIVKYSNNSQKAKMFNKFFCSIYWRLKKKKKANAVAKFQDEETLKRRLNYCSY